jgi:hypothetical protein
MRFYTYLWLREDGTPFYVGKGHDARAYRKGSPSGDRVLVQEFPSEADAFAAEKFLILYYGRKDLGTGRLNNLTEGGEGNVGHIKSDETVRKISAGLVAWHQTNPQHAYDKIGEAKRGDRHHFFGKTLSADHRHKMSESHKGHKHSDETKKRIADSVRRSLACKHAKSVASLKNSDRLAEPFGG